MATETQELLVTKDPRLTDVTDDELRAQFALATAIRDKESAANEAVIRIRALRRQVSERLAQDTLRVAAPLARGIADAAARLDQSIGEVEQEIYQVKNQSPKDKIAFPIRLNDRLTGLRTNLESGDERPTEAHRRVFRELARELDVQLGKLDAAERQDLRRLNEALGAAGLPPIAIRLITSTS